MASLLDSATVAISVNRLELIALKKLSLVSHALAQKIGGTLGEEQKNDKVTNLLSAMKNRDYSIRSEGRGPGAKWFVADIEAG